MNLNKKDTNLHYYHCDLTVKVCELKQQPSLASYLHVTTTMNCCSTFFRFDRLLKVVMMMVEIPSCVFYDSYSFSFWLSALNSLTFSLFSNHIKVVMPYDQHKSYYICQDIKLYYFTALKGLNRLRLTVWSVVFEILNYLHIPTYKCTK